MFWFYLLDFLVKFKMSQQGYFSMTKNFDETILKVVKSFNLKRSNEIYDEIDKITKEICLTTNVGRASVWLYGDKNESITCESLYLLDSNTHEPRGNELYKSDFEPYFTAMENERIIMATNAHEHHATRCFSEVYLKPLDIQSMYDTPIWKADKVIGVLCLEYLEEKENWGVEEKNFLTSMADHLGKIYEKKYVLELIESLEEKVQIRTEELEKALESLQNAQNFLIEKEKLASLGTVVAGVAHELRNPMNHILGASEILDELVNEEELDREAIKDITSVIQESSQRADLIIKDMLDQSIDKEDFTQENLSEVAVKSYKLALHKFSHPKIKSLYPDFEQAIEATTKVARQKMLRVFINIFENSLSSLKSKVLKDESFVPKLDFLVKEDNSYFEFFIRDNGIGIKEEQLKRIFEPFFTTKGTKGGTGLGLSIVYDIITAHNGFIEISSEEKEYTEVKLRIPVE